MKEIRKTKSVCPKCLAKIDAKQVEIGNRLYLIKKCKTHGIFKTLISKDSRNYKRINNFYLALNNEDKFKDYPPTYYNLFVTSRNTFKSNYSSKNMGGEIKKDEIKRILRRFKGTKIAVWGGEATQREDLPEIIKIIEKSGNIPALYTDGVKISNYDYLKELKKNGLKIVHMDFEGFDRIIPKAENTKKIIKAKIKALNNLKRLNISTGIQSTIVKGLNDDSMVQILNYAVKNNFIKTVFFKSHKVLCKSEVPIPKRLTTDDLLELIETQTNGKISKQDIYNFQMPLYLLNDFLNIKRCFYMRCIILLRKNGNYIPLTDILDFNKIQKKLYSCLKIDNPLIRRITMSIKILPDIFNYKAVQIYRTLFSMFIGNKIINRRLDSTKLDKSILYVSFGRECDRSNFDFASTQNCEIGEILRENEEIKPLAVSDLSREKILAQNF